MTQQTKPYSIIVSRAVLTLLEAEIPGFWDQVSQAVGEAGPQLFPDGSLLVEGNARADAYHEIFQRNPTGWALLRPNIYRALAPFPEELFRLDLPREYYKSMGRAGFGAGTGTPVYPSEYDLGHLALTVGFVRRPAKGVRERFANLASQWLASVREKGVFGDGPVLPASAGVEFDGLKAQFRVDARRSGQNTLNWFVLRALDFGLTVHPVREIRIADEELIEEMYGPKTSKAMQLPLRLEAVSKDPPPAGPEKANALPPNLPSDCTAYTELGSPIPLFRRPIFEWDALYVTAYFTAVPTPAEQAEFRKLIDAWGTVGSWGGLGGEGIHCLREVAFDAETKSATFYADMGDADSGLAVLVRLLKAFSDRILPLEAIAMGQGLPEAGSVRPPPDG